MRIATTRGTLIVLPAGAFHRFMPDENVFFYTMRLFQGPICRAIACVCWLRLTL